jgi:arylsulfatase A-like enzyme
MTKKWLSILGAGTLAGTVAGGAIEKPNIIVILTDDQGYQDLGCYGSPLIKTPNIDRMAAEGVRLTSFYAAASVCSPSRAGLLTGRHPERIGINGVYFPNRNDGMPLREITLGQILKSRGYATACIGKWHLGHLPQYLPTRRGFDYYYGIPYSNDMWLDGQNIPPAPDMVLRQGKTLTDYREADRNKPGLSRQLVPLMRGEECAEWPADQDTLTRRYAEEAVAFMRAHKEEPFFIYLTPAMPHVPLHASNAFRGKSARGLYGDCVEEIDWAVGEILRALREEKLEGRTLVCFSSDNGPWTTRGKNGGSALPLREGKNSSYEGGMRVPGIFWWPRMIPAGQTNDAVLSALDLLPTVAALAGAAPPDDRIIDGHDIFPILRGDKNAVSPWNSIILETTAVRAGPWKYRNGPLKVRYEKDGNPTVTQLFNLADDIGETTDLAEKHPAKTGELQAVLDAYKQTIKN